MVLEKTLEGPLDFKEIQPVHSKDQSWLFIGNTYVEAETPILWPPDAKNWLIWKQPDTWKVWRREEKGTIEHEMVGWHHQLNGHEFEWTPGVGNGQGGLVCFNSRGRKELEMTRDWTELKHGKDPLSEKTKPELEGQERLLETVVLSLVQHLFSVMRRREWQRKKCLDGIIDSM